MRLYEVETTLCSLTPIPQRHDTSLRGTEGGRMETPLALAEVATDAPRAAHAHRGLGERLFPQRALGAAIDI